MREHTYDQLVVIGISMLIGAAVGGFFGYAEGSPLLPGLLKGGIAGLLIGAASQYAFIFIYLKFESRPLLAFLIVTIVIGCGTAVFCLAAGTAFPLPALTVIAVSEIAGLTATACIFRYSKKINHRLREKQQELADTESSEHHS
jgi:hypothetical protein